MDWAGLVMGKGDDVGMEEERMLPAPYGMLDGAVAGKQDGARDVYDLY